MARVKRGVIAGARHKKILKKAKGYYTARRKVFRAAKQAVIKAGQYAYRDRKTNKRTMRSLWITRINAEARVHGLSYSKLIAGLNLAGLEIDRKVLADIAMNDPAAFAVIAQKAKASLLKQAEECNRPCGPRARKSRARPTSRISSRFASACSARRARSPRS